MPLAICRVTIVALLTLLFGSSLCLADEPAQQSIKALLGQGYKVVATSYIPREVQKDDRPVMLVTLQLEKTVAVCTLAVGAWETIASSPLAENTTICDVRAGQ